MNNQPTRTLEDVLGASPSEAFRSAWALLHACTQAELNYLRTDGVRAIQLTRIEEVDALPTSL